MTADEQRQLDRLEDKIDRWMERQATLETELARHEATPFHSLGERDFDDLKKATDKNTRYIIRATATISTLVILMNVTAAYLFHVSHVL